MFLLYNLKIIGLLPLLPFIFILQACLVCGLGVALSVLNVFYRDVTHLLGVILMLWFWMTPVFYRIDMVPSKFLWIFDINPMTAYIFFYQKIIFEGVCPSLWLILQVVLWALAALIGGMSVFSSMESQLLKRI